MANKELDKLRGMSVSDLNKSLETIYKEQFEDNLKLKTGQLNENKNPRILSGVVVSNKADKTITVKVERKVKHPLYGKIMRRSTKVHAHDENNVANIGDFVSVKECKPFSKTKTWILEESDSSGGDS
jgi:small subunit ribosomal protein S17